MRFSASQLKKWSSCQLQAKYIYIDGEREPSGSAAVYGSALHEAIDQIHKGADLEGAVTIFMDYLDNNEPAYWNRNTSMSSYKSKGPDIIKAYYKDRKMRDEYSDVIASEVGFMFDFGEHQVRGYIDTVELPHEQNTLNIIDNKSGKRPIMDALHLDAQMALYSLATQTREFWCGYPGQEDKYPGFENGEELYERFKNLPRDVYWLDLKKMERIHTGQKTHLDYGRLYRLMEQVARAVEHEVFLPSISADTCTYCSFKDKCPVVFDKPKLEW